MKEQPEGVLSRTSWKWTTTKDPEVETGFNKKKWYDETLLRIEEGSELERTRRPFIKCLTIFILNLRSTR